MPNIVLFDPRDFEIIASRHINLQLAATILNLTSRKNITKNGGIRLISKILR